MCISANRALQPIVQVRVARCAIPQQSLHSFKLPGIGSQGRLRISVASPKCQRLFGGNQNGERLPRLGHASDTRRKFADALARMSRSEDHRKKRPAHLYLARARSMPSMTPRSRTSAKIMATDFDLA
jgi:hypothetical protein